MFFFNDTATTEIYTYRHTLSLHDALPIYAHLPIGPIGKPTELMQITQMMLFKHSKYPNAAQAYMQFMMEADQYNPWMEAAIGYVSQPLSAYEANPIWTVEPKHTVYHHAAPLMLDNAHADPMGTGSAAVKIGR